VWWTEVRMRAERIAARQHGVIGGWQATAAGMSRRQIRTRVANGRWERLDGDVFGVVGAPDSWLRRVRAAVLAGGSGAAAIHATAARLLGIEGVPFEQIEIVTIRERRARLPDVTVHRSYLLGTHDHRRQQGVACTSPVRTVVDLSGRLDVAVLGGVVDQLLRRRMLDLSLLASTSQRLGRAPGRSPKRVEQVLRERWTGYDPGESAFEARVLRVIAAAGLPLPRQQLRVSVNGRRGRIDLAYPEHRLAIEVDSWAYHRSRTAFVRDRIKGNDLVLLGWRLVRIVDGMTDGDIAALVAHALGREMTSRVAS
jgi:hypothetical protein